MDSGNGTAPSQIPQLQIVPGIKPDHVAAIGEIVSSTGFFSKEEVDIALELAEAAVTRGDESGYLFLTAFAGGKLAAYTCYGPISGTQQRYDLYWIAVHESWRGKHVGRILLQATEEEIWRRGGRAIYAETSGRALYEPTRGFYISNGYEAEARLKDFYADGDDKVIFVKRRT